eukprot:CAMPEP_0197849660 /NCGR_PEP_ID=MMETSP1438-20131217/12821_1 /TAXON_ID=1461541 /ORGANISM="Pterosperma sp., Strain CCMP1384" /LENGTH=246 /DNA_ID=CAMNT_0043462443 /DNA_START=307 /DNA_END=1047 /DNA_ORIENTATION=-
MTRRAPGGADRISREAQEMESKLLELREAMLKEKLKRDSVQSRKAAGGTIWGSAQVPGRRGSNRTPAAATPRQRTPTTQQMTRPAKVDSGAGEAPSRPSTSGGDAQAAEGVGTGAQQPVGTSGVFNEEESHASFLQALEEWRNGGEEAASSASAAEPQKPKYKHTIDVQTEQLPVERPASAKGSYFEHLQMQALSGAATPRGGVGDMPLPPPTKAKEPEKGYDSDDLEDELLEMELNQYDLSTKDS